MHGVGALVVEDVESGVCNVSFEVLVAVVQDAVISRACRFLRSWAWMKLVS